MRPSTFLKSFPATSRQSQKGVKKESKRGQTTFTEIKRWFGSLFCMARRPRIVVPGVPHHVTQRGNNRQAVFFSEKDRIHYIQMLRDHSRRYDLRILGWCLMTNHVHLIAIPGTAESLARTLGKAHSQYSMEQNRNRGRVGHLWQNRFFSCPLDGAHLLAAMRYVDLNPVRAGIAPEACHWRWSSARAHTSPQRQDLLLDWPWFDWMKEARLGEWSYEDWKIGLGTEIGDEELDRMRRSTKLGEPLGSEEFVCELEIQTERRLRVLPRGRPRAAKAVGAVNVV